MSDYPTVRRDGPNADVLDAAVDPLGPPGTARPFGPQFDELVELIIDRIEQRVIDELERRGRRGWSGGF